MEILDTNEPSLVDLLNFTLEDETPKTISKPAETTPFNQVNTRTELVVEEELEWLSNKDAFPAVETCFGILSENPELVLSHKSPISVLENSTSSTNTNNSNTSNVLASCITNLKVPTNYPVRARSKRRRRKRKTCIIELPAQQSVVVKSNQEMLPAVGRRCLHCQADKTPQWRAGPLGPKTLCNACGVRYKSGRLLPEYRPANSPTFSSYLHSNSHRKVVEMRRQKYVEPGGGLVENEVCGYSSVG